MQRFLPRRLVIVVAIVFATASFVTSSFVTSSSAQDTSARFGRWKLKSEAPPPSSNVMTYEAFGSAGMKVTIEAVSAKGDTSRWWYTTRFDGADMPVTGNPGQSHAAVLRISGRINEIVNKKDGAVTQRLTNVLSPDGNTIGVMYMRDDGTGRTTTVSFATYERIPPPPDRIFINAKVWTADSTAPFADAMAVRGDRLLAVGATSQIRALAGSRTTITDLGGRLVVPGFNDAHWHLPSRQDAELGGAGSVTAIQQRLREYAKTLPPGTWVVGRGWSPSDFPDNRAHRKYLDEIFPDRPVALSDRDGHQTLVNSRALALARISATTPDPERGQIDRDSDGQATGLLKEAASSLVRRLIPPPSAAAIRAGLQVQMQRAASFGLTSLQEASGGNPSGATFAALARALADGSLRVRFRVSIPFEHNITPARLKTFAAVRDQHRGSLLRFGIAKGMLDGTVDAKTAAMLEPYVGGGSGLPFWTQPELNAAVAAYDKAGLQVELHAIGDRAVRMALDAYQHANSVNHTTGRRHRIEHIEVPALPDLPRFKALGVIASTQALFASPDANTLQNYAPLLGPERASHSNAFKIFDDAGAVQAFGSDYPVYPMNVLLGIYIAATREMPDGTPAGGWYPEHRISVEAALQHYTRDAAFAEFADGEKGVLAAGKLADFVVLSEDILQAPPSRLLQTNVLLTVMGGRETFRDPTFR